MIRELTVRHELINQLSHVFIYLTETVRPLLVNISYTFIILQYHISYDIRVSNASTFVI